MIEPSYEPVLLIGATYRHFKGESYKVLHIARHSETEEMLVIYQKLYGDQSIWARPYGMFIDHVVRNGYEGPRFQFLRNGEIESK